MIRIANLMVSSAGVGPDLVLLHAGIADRRYTFKVHPEAHRTQVRQAVEQLFGVHVERVNIVKVQAKPKRRGLFKGTRPGWKKAIVQVREGETIEIFEGAQV